MSWAPPRREYMAGAVERPAVREERLRSIRRSDKPPPLALSVWRGRSGRRYVVMIYTLTEAAHGDIESPGAVMLGVRRDAEGRAVIVGAGWRGSVSEAIALARADRANELHLHRLCDTDAERDALVEDLVGDDAL